jgi:hypothetical protein
VTRGQFFTNNTSTFLEAIGVPLVFNVGSAERARIDSSGRLLVGTATSPSRADAMQVIARAGVPFTYLIDTTANRGVYQYASSSGTNSYWELGELVGPLGSETLPVSYLKVNGNTKWLEMANSGWGLKLPATNGTTYNTDPNTLDCYAEKDLTATMTCGTSGTITLSTNTLKFTRIGRVVHIYGRLVIGSVSSPVGRLAINTGVGANEYPLATGSGSAWLLSWLAGFTAVPQLLVVSGSGTVYLDRYVAGSVGTDCAAYAQAGSEVVISITYIV